MKICFENHTFHKKSLPLLEAIKKTLQWYEGQGLPVSLRQLYYRLFNNGHILNLKSEYQKIGNMENNAKLAGIIDMESLEDRTRYIREIPYYSDIKDFLVKSINRYNIDLWEGQEYRVMVFVEKDALISIIEDAAFSLGCPCFSCRGFPSITSIWETAQRIEPYKERDILTVILYLGDHDCTGVVIDKKIQERLTQFGAYVHVKRIALTMPQIREYNIPGIEAKTKKGDEKKKGDPNYNKYVETYGDIIWELDGLPPDVIYNLVIENIKEYMDIDLYNERIDQLNNERELLEKTIIDLNF